MTDHYERLGVEPDATKDEIKAAYRAEIENADTAERAELNRAWNVLSDPIQRQRYDESRGADGDASDEAAAESSTVPARRITGARRAAQTTDAGGANGDGNANGDGSAGDGGGRRPLPPTMALPDDLVMADPKTRSLAMLFDFSVLLVIFLVVQFVGVSVIDSQYPKETDRVDVLTEQVKDANEAKDKADDAKDNADDALADAKKDGSSSDVAEAQDKADDAAVAAKASDSAAKNLEDDLLEAQDKLRPMYLLITGVVLVLALAYTVPMSARSGQTIGKRLRKVRLVRIDGSAPGWSASLIHYGVPIVLTLALSGFLGPLALVLGLGSVLWNIRDRNRQGVHDKLAKTFVVQA